MSDKDPNKDPKKDPNKDVDKDPKKDVDKDPKKDPTIDINKNPIYRNLYEDEKNKYFYKEFAKQQLREVQEKYKEQRKNREEYIKERKAIIENYNLKKLIITLKVRGSVKYDIPEFLPSYIENSNPDLSDKIYFDISNNLNFKNIKKFFDKTKLGIYNINDSKVLFTNVKLYENYLKILQTDVKKKDVDNIKKIIKNLILIVNKLKNNTDIKNLKPDIDLEIEYIPDKLNKLEKMIIRLQIKILRIIDEKIKKITNPSSTSSQPPSSSIAGGQSTYDKKTIESFYLKLIELEKNINYLKSLNIINDIAQVPFNNQIYNSINALLIVIDPNKLLLDIDNIKNVGKGFILKQKLSQKNLNINDIKNILSDNNNLVESTKINYKKWKEIEDDKNKNETIDIDIINDKININYDNNEDEDIDNIDIVVGKNSISKKDYDITINNIDYILKSFFNSQNIFKFYNKNYTIHSYLWNDQYRLTTKSNCKILVTLYVYEEDVKSYDDKKKLFNNQLSCKIKKDKLYNDFLSLIGYQSDIDKENLKYRIKRKKDKTKIKKRNPIEKYKYENPELDPYFRYNNLYYPIYNDDFYKNYKKFKGGGKYYNLKTNSNFKNRTKRINKKYYKLKLNDKNKTKKKNNYKKNNYKKNYKKNKTKRRR